ncbi:MAG: translocation/assembly module TamB domain-containing protein [Bacteroidota bacterium]
MPPLLAIPRRIVQWAAVTAVLLVIGFFGLTRTEVGRDALRIEVERQFSRTFDGELTIGELTGNLVNDLYARDVRLFDDRGRLVAVIDSAVAQPHWRDLFRRSVTASRIVLFRPDVHVTFDQEGDNLRRIFRRVRTVGADGRSPWSFQSADIQIHGGTVRTSNAGYIHRGIERNHVFDFTRAAVDHLEGRAVLRLDPGMLLVDLRALSADLITPGFEVHRVRGRIRVDSNQVALDRVEFDAGGSSGDLTLVMPRAGVWDSPATSELELTLLNGVVDHDSLRALFPLLPLADRMEANVRLRGTLGAFVLEHATVRRGRSILHLSGSVLGLPGRGDYELSLDQSRLAYADLQAVLPSVRLGELRRAGMVTGDVYARGDAVFERGIQRIVSSEGDIHLVSAKGRVSGPFQIEADSASFSFLTDLRMQDLKLSALTDRFGEQRTEVSGHVRLDARRGAERKLSGQVEALLGPSRLGGRMLDSLRVDLTLDGRSGNATLTARQGAGIVTGSGVFDGDASPASFRADLKAARLDVGRLWTLHDSLETSFGASFHITGTGSDLQSLNARVDAQIDPSLIRIGEEIRHVPSHVHRFELRQTRAGPRLDVGGDVLELRIGSDASLEQTLAAADAWRHALMDGLRAEVSRRTFRSDGDSIEVTRTAGDALPLQRILLTADGRIVNSAIISSMAADLEDLSTDLSISSEFRLGPAVDGWVFLSADSLDIPSARLRDARAQLRFSMTSDLLRSEESRLSLHAESATFTAGGRTLQDAALLLDIEDRTGRLELSTSEEYPADRVYLASSIDLREYVYRLSIERFQVSARPFEWTLSRPSVIDLYSDAVVISDLELQSISSRTASPQVIRFDGALSRDSRDTLSAFVENVRIGDFSDMLQLRDPLGGVVHGHVSLTGLFDQPEVTGNLEVDRLVYAGTPIGRVTARSQYVPGQPDIALNVAIQPLSHDEAAVPHERIPAGETANTIAIDGTFRLPTPGPDRRLTDPGRLDLTVHAYHADAFFFKHIFRVLIDEAGGVLRGDGSITGDFRRPVFNAELALTEGRVRIPRFDLAYDIDGTVTVDSSAIRLSNMLVRDATGGRAHVDGDILFNQYRYFSFDLRGELDRLQFMNVLASSDLGFYGDVRGSGTVTLTGPLHDALLASPNASIHPDSRTFIALHEERVRSDAGFIVFADSTGRVPDLNGSPRRQHLLSRRPAGERTFVDALEMDLNITAPQGTTLHLVIDPVLGDVINATGRGRVQLQRLEGDFTTYGTLNVYSGDYLFTAGDVFVRRFLIDGGTISWDGDPANASMNIEASYRTRASAAGLNIAGSERLRIPLIVRLLIEGRVAAPAVDLRLLVDRNEHETITSYESLESILNQPERSAEYATSVMLTNTFLLTTSMATSGDLPLSTTRNQLAFTSLSQLVATQLNRYLNQALPNIDVSLGLQGENAQDLDVTYGIALRLLDERLIIRGQGLYQNEPYRNAQQNLLDEFTVEIRLSSSVSVEMFYRREGDILGSDHTLANTTGAGLSYETQFSSWSGLFDRLFRRHRNSGERRDEDVIADAAENDDAERGSTPADGP